MVTATRRMTADDLLLMPDDGFRYELVSGELRERPFLGHVHGRRAGYILVSIGIHAMENDLGIVYSSNTGFQFATDHVRAPNVAFVSRERADAAKGPEGYFPGPPDVAVELASSSDSYMDMDERISDYLEAGTLAVIVVNPRNRTVRIHRPSGDVALLTESDTLAVDDVIPGWRMPVRDIFRRRIGGAGRDR